MNKIFHVALREFLATVMTKGFIIGLLVMPVVIGVMIVVMPRLMNEKPPKVTGEVAVIDPSGEVTAGIADYLRPEKIAERRYERRRRAQDQAPEQVRGLVAATGDNDAAQKAIEAALGEVPELTVVDLDSATDLEDAKRPLHADQEARHRLALLVIHDDAVVRPGAEAKFGGYDLFVREKLDDRIEDEIRGGARSAIVDARVRHEGLDRGYIEALTQVARSRSTTVTAAGEQQTNEVLNMLLPAGFMVLLLASVLTGGQQIMTTTIEEKSSRVVEVLLSAVSPMQFMTGKILGQMCVGFVILGLYAAMGVATLFSFAMLGLLDMSLIFYLFVFYLIAYFILASIMAAIGAAVNELREAQSLMTPVMLTVMIPWMLWLPITRDPNSLFATVLSFVPPINTFVMLLRMTSTSPPPLWQTWASIGVGVVSVWFALKFAAKVFRIGLLMFGKPPNFATLVRWVRMA